MAGDAHVAVPDVGTSGSRIGRCPVAGWPHASLGVLPAIHATMVLRVTELTDRAMHSFPIAVDHAPDPHANGFGARRQSVHPPGRRQRFIRELDDPVRHPSLNPMLHGRSTLDELAA